MKSINFTKGVTHGGVFHADDVFSAALLKILNPDIIIERKFKVTQEDIEDENTIIFDIGGGKFDHHQPDAEIRESGVRYAAFGLLWREFMSDELFFKSIDRDLVEPIDTQDNGGERNLLSDSIRFMNPGFDQDSTDQSFFEAAVEVAKKMLESRINSTRSMDLARVEASAALESARSMNKKFMVLDRFVPWQGVVIGTEMRAVVYPSLRGGYQLQIPQISFDDRTLVFSVPSEWIDGSVRPEGMTFCHATGFVMSFDTLEHAIACAESICAQ